MDSKTELSAKRRRNTRVVRAQESSDPIEGRDRVNLCLPDGWEGCAGSCLNSQGPNVGDRSGVGAALGKPGGVFIAPRTGDEAGEITI